MDITYSHSVPNSLPDFFFLNTLQVLSGHRALALAMIQNLFSCSTYTPFYVRHMSLVHLQSQAKGEQNQHKQEIKTMG